MSEEDSNNIALSSFNNERIFNSINYQSNIYAKGGRTNDFIVDSINSGEHN